jgi:murein DD-endopeptidase MepM/ murein hydrolase activator NlpD
VQFSDNTKKTTDAPPLTPKEREMLDEGPAPRRIVNSSSPRPAPPTFVQIRKPATAGHTRRTVGIVLGGLALVAACIWFVPREPVPAAPVEIESPQVAEARDTSPEATTPPPPEPEVLALQEAPLPDDTAQAGPEPGVPAVTPEPDQQAPMLVLPVIETSARLKKGGTVAGILHELGIAANDVSNAVTALKSRVRLNRLPVGQEINVTLGPADDADEPLLMALAIRPEPRREITLERNDTGDFSVEEQVFETVARLQRAAGTVDGSVIVSAEAAGVPRPALVEMLRAFSWDVNFQHDIKVGDRFDVLIEQAWTSDGWPVDAGRVLWAELTTGGGEERYSIYRFKPHDGEEFFYNSEGESVVKALLRTPLNMSRISSRFGMRHHPVLRFTRLHAGIDFAAPPGTPILAAGAGRVVEAGPNGGYGRWVKISHANGLATGYAHLSRIAPGVRRSARVRQGQVIGYVGSSGLSTGPHLHFELHRNGRPVDPLSMARTALRSRLGGADLARFRERVAEIDRARESATAPAQP